MFSGEVKSKQWPRNNVATQSGPQLELPASIEGGLGSCDQELVQSEPKYCAQNQNGEKDMMQRTYDQNPVPKTKMGKKA